MTTIDHHQHPHHDHGDHHHHHDHGHQHVHHRHQIEFFPQVDIQREYDLVQLIGEGWFSRVYLAERRSTREEVSIIIKIIIIKMIMIMIMIVWVMS